MEDEIILYNNGIEARRYRISTKVITVDPSREQIIPSPGYTWIPKLRWVSVREKRFKMEASGNHTVKVKVNVPDKPKHYDKRWEALLWIEPDEGRPRFVRVQVETVETGTGK